MRAMRRFFHSFTGRMMALATAIHVPLALLFAFNIHRMLVADIKDDFINKVRSGAYDLGQSLESKETRSAVEEFLKEAVLAGQVEFADLVLDGGEVIYGDRAAAQSEKGFEEDFNFDDHDRDVYDIAVQVAPAISEMHGTLHLGYDKRPTLDRIRSLYRRGFILVAAYFAVGLILTWISARFLANPMRRLRDAARRVALGHTTEELTVETGIEEVASLAQDLEWMRRELVRRGNELHSLAYYDGLTGLENRAFFSQSLQRALEAARRRGAKLALLYLDLDRFKRVNDTLGHGAGDELLRSVGKRLQEVLRPSDIVGVMNETSSPSVARLGGDEFCVLLQDLTDVSDADKVAQRILDALSDPISIGGCELYATTSIGIAFYPDHGQDAETLLKNADSAMYQAKHLGQNRFSHYAHAINGTLHARLELESELHRAVELGQLVMYYQPLVDITLSAPSAISASRLTGVEALVRWNHPRLGLLSPAEFVPIAEESDLILAIGEWVLRTACAQWKDWQARGTCVRVAVNVSAKQFQQRAFVHTVKRAVEDFGMGKGMLDLEITETVLMAKEDESLARLNELRAIGVRISVDDFGTGYSSLNYLKQFSPDALKIDASFVRGLPDNSHNAAIVRAIVAIARSLNLSIVAEGVENEAQWRYLSQNGCDEMQGFLIAEPMLPEEFVEFAKGYARNRGAADPSDQCAASR
jgi:diguanylate cyclase (GGDEF)-like protein